MKHSMDQSQPVLFNVNTFRHVHPMGDGMTFKEPLAALVEQHSPCMQPIKAEHVLCRVTLTLTPQHRIPCLLKLTPALHLLAGSCALPLGAHGAA